MKSKKNKIGLSNFLLVIVIIALGIGGYYWYSNNNGKTKESVFDEYSVLTNYLKSNGYTCNDLLTPGSTCEKKATINSYVFYRFDDGLQYTTISQNYKVSLLSRQGGNVYFIETYDGAFDGYQNKKYYCITDNDTLLGAIEKCSTDNNEVLDNDVYLTVVKTAFKEVDDILEHSGFNATKLATLYKWEK